MPPTLSPSPLLVRLTPPGRGAIASLRIEGPEALELVARELKTRSGRPLADFPPGRIVVGQIGGGEEVVVTRRSDSAVEVHCHGGLAAIARLEEIFVSRGCRCISWQEWAARQESDPLAAAAWLALAEARTARTAAILLDQYQGALRRAMDEIQSSYEAGVLDAARRQAEALLAHAATGLHLVRPWQVVIAGEPNVGKSSLLNALAGYQRTIVDSTPGTTRDLVGLQTAVDGWPVEIFDSAGLRESGDSVERAGVALAWEKILAADLVVLVFDRSLPWSAQDQALVERHPSALLVHNKSDLPAAAVERPPGLEVSAFQQAGIEALCEEIAVRLVPEPPGPGAAVPFEPWQIERIRRYIV